MHFSVNLATIIVNKQNLLSFVIPTLKFTQKHEFLSFTR